MGGVAGWVAGTWYPSSSPPPRHGVSRTRRGGLEGEERHGGCEESSSSDSSSSTSSNTGSRSRRGRRRRRRNKQQRKQSPHPHPRAKFYYYYCCYCCCCYLLLLEEEDARDTLTVSALPSSLTAAATHRLPLPHHRTLPVVSGRPLARRRRSEPHRAPCEARCASFCARAHGGENSAKHTSTPPHTST